MFAYLNGRSGRKEYWIGVVLLLLVGVGLAAANVGGASGATTFLWILIWNRRLHDIGQTGWNILIPLGLMIAIMAAAALFGGKELLDAFEYAQAGNGPVTDRGAWIFIGIVVVALAIQFGFTIWLGIKQGDPGDNRFGPPPPAI
jgi:uncharacterized membrane protein YhaH (DUF805 family)